MGPVPSLDRMNFTCVHCRFGSDSSYSVHVVVSCALVFSSSVSHALSGSSAPFASTSSFEVFPASDVLAQKCRFVVPPTSGLIRWPLCPVRLSPWSASRPVPEFSVPYWRLAVFGNATPLSLFVHPFGRVSTGNACCSFTTLSSHSSVTCTS